MTPTQATPATEATQPDGLPYEITWRGCKWLVPPMAKLLTKALLRGGCVRPDGERVPCDHPDSWLSLCGLMPPRE